MKKLTIFLLILSIYLTGCATAYKPQGFTGGYSEMALSQDTYIVSFGGNAYTGQETVLAYLLRRSAELTLSKGYKYFIITDSGTKADSSIHSTPTTVNTQTYGNYSGYGSANYGRYNFYGYGNANSYTTVSPGSQYQMNKYRSNAVIKMLQDNKEYPQAYDAAIILSNFNKER